MAGLKRNAEAQIDNLLQLFPVVAIIGVRQCGKTEISRRVRPDWKYVDLEQETAFERINADPEFFLSENGSGLILDEAQELPKIFKALRGAVDSKRKLTNRFLITGSSSPELIKNISESLAGRAATVHLGTLKTNEIYSKPLSPFYDCFLEPITETSFSELSQPYLTPTEVKQAWFYGGYPEPITHSDPSFWNIWMNEYRGRYIERDLKKLFPKLDAVRYRRFLTVLANLSGAIANKSDIAAAVESSEPTIKDYIDIADGTFVWRKLPSFTKNIKKQVVQSPKGHFRDSGMLHHLMKLTSLESLESHPIVGRSFESFIIEEIIKGLNAKGIVNWSSHYYRTKNKAEIDLILDGPFGVVPIEIKLGFKPAARSLTALKNFVKEHELPLGILINNAAEIEFIAPKILQIPCTYL